jgi:ABC-type dipeptide/oligopeptide/nickel transport systems, permease components
LLFTVSVLSFVLIAKSPIDPLVSYIGPESTLSEEAKMQIAEHWGLNKSLSVRYIEWLKNIFSGDFGISLTYKKPVMDVIFERFSLSIVLILPAWILSGILGYLLGILSGMNAGSILDKIISTFCIVLQSAPSFWIGLIILSLFAVKLGWFPIGMAVPPGKLAAEVTLADRIRHLILPVFTLTITGLSKITLFTRQKTAEAMDSEYILFAKARGETTGQIVKRHLVRNTILPAVTLHFASFSELFGGMALSETVFSYPGIGSAATAAALGGDVPLLLGIALLSALFVFCGNLTANIIYGVVDPRLQRGESYV